MQKGHNPGLHGEEKRGDVHPRFPLPFCPMWSSTRSQTIRKPGMITYARRPAPTKMLTISTSFSTGDHIPEKKENRRGSLHSSATIPSAQVSTRFRMASSWYEEIRMFFRLKVT